MTMLAPLLLAAGLLGPMPTPTPTTPDDPLAEAKGQAGREEWAEAADHFRAFLKAHPDSPRAPEARFWVGFCRVKLGQHDEAVEALRPFETTLARDTWADDALLHLGSAFRGQGENDLALAVWKRLLGEYSDSVWHNEALLKIVEVLFYDAEDYAACLPYCERVVREVPDPDASSQARLLGAYCLNVLKRFDDADRWADRWLDRGDAHEEAWRRVLAAQRDLIRGHPDAAMVALESIDADFPDLDEATRLDVLLQAATVLRKNGQLARARTLLLAELHRLSRRGEDDFGSLLDGLDESFGPDRRADFLGALTALAADAKAPPAVRIAARDRQARALRESDQVDRAADLLRKALAEEPSEYGRVKAATALAELLAEAKEDRPAARRVLEELLPKLRRRDLAHQAREELGHYKDAEAAGKE